MESEDPQSGHDGPSDHNHGDLEGTSGKSLGPKGVYTSPDGAMYIAGKLHIEVLNEVNTKVHLVYSVLIAPGYLKQFNEHAAALENTVLITAEITAEI
jgi:hypothetical protein